MTVLSPTAHVAPPVPLSLDRVRRTWLAHVSVAALLAWWAWPLTRATGGRDPHALSIGLVLLIGALAATRPWRSVPSRVMAVAASLPLTAFTVCLVAPTGWVGANEAASYAFAAGTYVVVRGYAQTADRRRTLLAVVALAGTIEFAEAWLPWWGSGNPAQMMWGTFYWHNQFAAFLLPAAIVGVGLVVWPVRQYRSIGWVAAPLCSAGVLFSTSRATLALLLLGWLATAVVAALRPDRRRAVPRLVLVALASLAVTFALTGPPFFAHRAVPTSAVNARDRSQSLEGNGLYRTQLWEEGALVFRQHPVAGTGFHGFAAAAVAVRPTWHHSAFVHNAWLQAASDGGAVFGIPFLVASLAIIVGLARRLRRCRRRRVDALTGVIGPLACGLLLTHSLVDFDVSYPALLALIAVLAAAVAHDKSSAEPGIGPVATVAPRRAMAVVAVLAALAGVGVQTSWHGGLRLNVWSTHVARNGAAR